MELKDITQEIPDSVIESIPISKFPEEILDYYAKYGYWKRKIPFSSKIVKEIAEIIKSGNEQEKSEEYDENMTFDKLTIFPHYPLW